MPIKLKKTDIQNDLDDPVEGYVILGFDETGRLVSKDSEGTYGTIVPTVPTGDFENIRSSYLTVGNRTTPFDELTFGLRSISIGNNNEVSSENSSAQGINLIVTGENSSAQGSNIEVNGDNSFGGGFGPVARRIKVDGTSSFAFFRSDDTLEDKGILSDDSAILGGLNHKITSGTGSVIIGGVNNTISGSNIIILGGNNVIANDANSVYIPKLILSTNTQSTAPNGTIRYSGSDIQARIGGDWVSLTDTGAAGITSVSAGNGMTFTTITSTGSVTLGTPSSITTSSTNNVTANSHTHQIVGFLPTAGGTMTGTLNTVGISNTGANRISSVRGFEHPFTAFGGGGSVTWNVSDLGLNRTITRSSNFTVTLTGLANGLSGILVITLTSTYTVTATTNVGGYSVYRSGNFTSLPGGRYILTWASTSNELYFNIASYS